MQVEIDSNAGFCFGVVKAIAAAEAQLGTYGHLYCLGDIVHNNAEVCRLKNKGLEIIDYDGLERIGQEEPTPSRRVLIRAHGEPPSTYQTAKRLGIALIDATCPIVLALQRRILKGHQEMRAKNGQVVIFGKPGHAEVIGLNGQTDNSAIIVSDPHDLDAIDFHRPIRLYSQTTKNREDYHRLIDNIAQRMKASSCSDFEAFDTICNRVSHRAEQLQQFALSVDVLLFVSGEHSSNGHYLYQYCRNVQPKTYFLTKVEEIKSQWTDNCKKVGITGATSTPRWLMEAVADQLLTLNQ